MELDYYQYLLEQMETGDVIDIELQPVFLLQEKFTYMGKNIRKIEYKADFRVKYEDGRVEVIDVKGLATDCFKLKFKIARCKYKDTIFKCVKKYKGEWVDLGI